jgi:ABC-2 type transport system ATP-binding protein
MSIDNGGPASRDPRRPVATLDGVTRRYGHVTAIRRLRLQIASGETVALLGPNGAGKTTAVEMLLGLTSPDAGQARLFGGPPAAAVAAGRVGAMLQDAGLPAGAKVAELIAVVGSLYRDPLPVDEVLRLCDLTDVAGRQVQGLSGGQRQRVRLALALAGNPDLLVLDEPTAALDVDARRAFWTRARDHVSAGRALLFATHRLEEADAVADRVLVIAGGQLVADGTPDAIRAHADSARVVRFGVDDPPVSILERLVAVEAVDVDGPRVSLYTTDPDRTVRDLLHRVPHVRDLDVARAGMEDAFLTLTRTKGVFSTIRGWGVVMTSVRVGVGTGRRS